MEIWYGVIHAMLEVRKTKKKKAKMIGLDYNRPTECLEEECNIYHSEIFH